MAFYDLARPWAEKAAAATGLPVQLVLAQWAHETGYGNSSLAAKNNWGGIKYTGRAGSYNADGQHAGYNTLDAFVTDYVRVIRLPFYDHIRAAAGQGASPTTLARLFTMSPPGVPRYAEDTAYSDKLINILNRDFPNGAKQLATVPPLSAQQSGNSITLTAVADLPQLSKTTLAAVGALAAVVILLGVTRD